MPLTHAFWDDQRVSIWLLAIRCEFTYEGWTRNDHVVPHLLELTTLIRPPSNIDLRELEPRPASSSPPINRPTAKDLEQPTFATYLILRRKLGEIVAKITQHFQNLRDPRGYKDIEVLGNEMRRFVSSLPRAFDISRPDKSFDKRESSQQRAGGF